MKNLIRLTDYNRNDVLNIFEIADDLKKGKYAKSEKILFRIIICFAEEAAI